MKHEILGTFQSSCFETTFAHSQYSYNMYLGSMDSLPRYHRSSFHFIFTAVLPWSCDRIGGLWSCIKHSWTVFRDLTRICQAKLFFKLIDKSRLAMNVPVNTTKLLCPGTASEHLEPHQPTVFLAFLFKLLILFHVVFEHVPRLSPAGFSSFIWLSDNVV